jgi:hypothetical protein
MKQKEEHTLKKINTYLRIALCLLVGALFSTYLLTNSTWAKYVTKAVARNVDIARYAAWDPDIRWHRLAGAWTTGGVQVAHGYDPQPPGSDGYIKGWTDITWIIDKNATVSTWNYPSYWTSLNLNGRAPTHLVNDLTETTAKFTFWKEVRRTDGAVDAKIGTLAEDIFHSNTTSSGGAHWQQSNKMSVIVSPTLAEEIEKLIPLSTAYVQNNDVTWSRDAVALPNGGQVPAYVGALPNRGYVLSGQSGSNAMREDPPIFNPAYVRDDYAESVTNKALWDVPGTDRTVNVQFYETIEYCWQAVQAD